MGKKIYNAVVLILSLAAIIYTGLWGYSAYWFHREIENIYKRAEKNSVEFLGPRPSLGNFPFVPEIHYNGGFKTGNASLLFPVMYVRGYPIASTNLHISFPEGIALAGIVDPALWSLDTVEADISIPNNLPATFTQEDISEWHERGGNVDIRHYAITKNALISDGKGSLTVDDELQPVFLLNSTIKGYEDFIHIQKDKDLIEGFAAAIGTSILNGLATTDPVTGEKSVNLHVSVKNRMLTVGPIQALELPLIVWDKRSLPDPHQ